MCPPLKPVTNGLYIATPKNVARKMQRMSMEPVSLLQSRWGKQYKSCPTGVSIPKTKVKCVLQCDAGFVLKAGNIVKRVRKQGTKSERKICGIPDGIGIPANFAGIHIFLYFKPLFFGINF